MVRVWGRRNSANVQKVLWLLDTMAVPWHHVDAGGNASREHAAALRARNPNALVPVLEDGPITLWESNAILRHIARAHGGGVLYGTDHARMARVDQWLDWQQCTLWPPMLPWFIGLARTPESKRDTSALEQARQTTHSNFAILEMNLSPGDYIVGSHLTLADIALGSFIHRWFTLNPEAMEEQVKLHALYSQYLALPAFQENVLAQPF